MKATLLLAITILSFTAACTTTSSPPPRPGFRVATIRREGSFEYPLPRSVTKGTWQQDSFSPEGNVYAFNTTASNSGTFDIVNGRATALWYIEAIANWNGCTGRTVYSPLNKGELNYLVCARIDLLFPLSPSSIYADDDPIQLTATLEGVNTINGMPVFHFENYSGQLVGIESATGVNGNNITVSSSCLYGKPSGKYTVKVYNASSTDAAPLGVSSITIARRYINPCDIDNLRPNCP
jgi:hypothetical protein